MTLAILMPLRSADDLQPETERALRLHTPEHRLFQVVGLPVDQARNVLTEQVLALPNPPDVVLWIDSDAFWGAGAIEALLSTMERHPNYAMMCGAFSMRSPNFPLVAYLDAEGTNSLRPVPIGQRGGNCFLGDVVQIAVAGFHFAAVRTAALRSLGPEPFNVHGATEDFSFCRQVHEAGLEIACATGIVVGHLDADTGLCFAPGQPPYIVQNGVARSIEERDVAGLRARGVKVTQTRQGLLTEYRSPNRSRGYGTAVERFYGRSDCSPQERFKISA